MTFPFRLAGLALLSAAATPLLAHSFAAGKLTIENPWSRQTAPGQKVGGGFLTIINNGEAADRLISATSTAAGEVQLHTMSMDGGVMRMRQLKDGIAIPAGKAVALKPGGLHVMFIGLKRPFLVGQSIPVTLRFERQGAVKVTFQVEPVGSTGPAEARHGQH